MSPGKGAEAPTCCVASSSSRACAPRPQQPPCGPARSRCGARRPQPPGDGCARQQPPCRSSSHGSPARCVRGPVWATKTGRLVIQNRKDLYYFLLDRYARGDRRGGYTHTVCSAGARAARTRTATALSIPVNVQYGSVRSMPKKDLCGRQCRPRRLSLRLQRASRALAVGVRMPCRVRVDDLTSGQCSCSVLGRDGRTWQPLLRLGVVC